MMLSIIVNHYRSPEVLKLCLKYIKQNALQNYELIVTDSETTEKTELIMRYDFPEVKFLPAKSNIGFAKSVNRGLAVAQGDYFLIINADVIVSQKNAIPKILKYMQVHEEIGILGPKLLNINGGHQPSCFRFYSPLTILARRTPFGKTPWGKNELNRFIADPVSVSTVNSLIQNQDDRLNYVYSSSTPMRDKLSNLSNPAPRPIDVDWLMGSALLVRRTAYEQVGGLCEDYFMYMEDVDWCRNFWEKGWKIVYYPKVFFYHYHFQASKKRGAIIDLFTNKYTRTHLLSAIKYFRKYGLKVPRYGV